MSVNNPYEVLGISPTATDDEVKEAYRALAKKYHPDNYGDNPLSDLAQEKMQEINEAYDTIVRMRKQGGAGRQTGGNTSSGSTAFADIRHLIRVGRVADAETLLDGIPSAGRNAEWHFLKGNVLYKKGWLEDAYNHVATASRMDPSNAEYRSMLNQMNMRRQTGGYQMSGNQMSGCSGCDMCQGLICADCCCECMGGDLIRCC